MDVIETTAPVSAAGAALGSLLTEQSDRATLLLVSGGSALAILESVPASTLSPHLTITVLDERYSPDPAVNNFSQLSRTHFFERAQAQGAHFIPTTVTEGMSRTALRAGYAQALTEWHHNHPTGQVLATLGIGADGHTAGIFPNVPTVDFNGPEWVVDYTVPEGTNPYPERVTVTNTFLKTMVDSAVGYFDRVQKPTLVGVVRSPAAAQGLPLSVLHEMKAVRFFIGRAEGGG
jgi:6-phosphogluconolactonase/glucosamine-6-phosphate isomerase/deaminase